MSKFVLEYDNVAGHATLTVLGDNAEMQEHNWKRWLTQIKWFIDHSSPHGCDYEGWEVIEKNKIVIKYKLRSLRVKADM